MDYPEHSTLIAFIKGELDELQRDEINQWISASPKHLAHYNHIRNIWDQHGRKAESYKPDLDAAWGQVESSIDSSRNLWHWVYRMAAAVVLLVGISYFMTRRVVNSDTAEISEHFAATSSQVVTLPDGSIVTIKKGSRIFFDKAFDQNMRYLKLKGEAFFEIARDEDRPFIIETSYSKTEVLGTSFNIAESTETTILNVVSGKVAFSSNDEAVILTKGDQGTLLPSGQLLKNKQEDANFLSWKTGQLTFDNASLPTVLEDLGQHYEVQFQSESQIATTLTSQFDNQSLEEVLAIVSGTLDIEITSIDSKTYIVK